MYTWTCKQKSNHVGDFPLETREGSIGLLWTMFLAAVHIVEPKQQRKRKQLFPNQGKHSVCLD